MPVIFEKRKQRRYIVGPANTYPYPAHIHDAVEIVILRKGYLNMTVNGKNVLLEPDSILAVFPKMVHSYESSSEGAEGLFVGYTPGVLDEFHTALTTMWPVNPLVKIEPGDEELRRAADKLEQYSEEGGVHPLLLPYIHVFTGCLFMKLELAPCRLCPAALGGRPVPGVCGKSHGDWEVPSQPPFLPEAEDKFQALS